MAEIKALNQTLAIGVSEVVEKSLKYIKGKINSAYKAYDEKFGDAVDDDAKLKLAALDVLKSYEYGKDELTDILEGKIVDKQPIPDSLDPESVEFDDDVESFTLDDDNDEDVFEEVETIEGDSWDSDETQEEVDDWGVDDDSDKPEPKKESILDFWNSVDEKKIFAKSEGVDFEKTPSLYRLAGVKYTLELVDVNAAPARWTDQRGNEKTIWKVILKNVYPKEAAIEYNRECDDEEKRFKPNRKYSLFMTALMYATFKVFVLKNNKEGIPPKVFTFKDKGGTDNKRYTFGLAK